MYLTTNLQNIVAKTVITGRGKKQVYTYMWGSVHFCSSLGRWHEFHQEAPFCSQPTKNFSVKVLN
jgi:hypothetical protein